MTHMMRILKKPVYFNLIFQGLLLFTVGQQIYFPQAYKYMHLVVLVVRMLVSEMYQNEHQTSKYDPLMIFLILTTASISIIEKIGHVNLGIIYLSALLGLTIILSLIISGVIKDSKQNLELKMHPKHIEAFQKSSVFTLGIFYALYAITIASFAYTFYELITLIFGA